MQGHFWHQLLTQFFMLFHMVPLVLLSMVAFSTMFCSPLISGNSSSAIANQILWNEWFLKLPWKAKPRVVQCERSWKTVWETGVKSDPAFCLGPSIENPWPHGLNAQLVIFLTFCSFSCCNRDFSLEASCFCRASSTLFCLASFSFRLASRLASAISSFRRITSSSFSFFFLSSSSFLAASSAAVGLAFRWGRPAKPANCQCINQINLQWQTKQTNSVIEVFKP